MFLRALGLFIISLFLLASSTRAELVARKEVLLDNDKVEVVRLTYPSGTESGMHTHIYASRVVYVVNGGKLALIPADTKKESVILDATSGQTLFLPAQRHNVKNIGQTTVVFVETELK